jgi:hypothetical protein
MGYTHVRHYGGGMSDWRESGGPLEGSAPGAGLAHSAASAPSAAPPELAAPARGARATVGDTARRPSRRLLRNGFTRSTHRRTHGWAGRLLDSAAERTIGQLLLVWACMTVLFGLLYWGAGFIEGEGLIWQSAGDRSVPVSLSDALYFSFVTVLSIGYGDLVPSGAVRVLALLQGAAGLLIFGAIISRLVSRRQDELLEEIHRNSFEDQIERVRTGLHLVLAELQVLTERCQQPGERPDRVMTRVESTATVFEGEMRTIHALLYRPHLAPDEGVLEAILASLSSGLAEMLDLLTCLPPGSSRTESFQATLKSMASLSNEICGDCVPREYAPRLRDWMDRIQAMSGRLA